MSLPCADNTAGDELLCVADVVDNVLLESMISVDDGDDVNLFVVNTLDKFVLETISLAVDAKHNTRLCKQFDSAAE